MNMIKNEGEALGKQIGFRKKRIININEIIYDLNVEILKLNIEIKMLEKKYNYWKSTKNGKTITKF
jgi:hypothetical protein